MISKQQHVSLLIAGNKVLTVVNVIGEDGSLCFLCGAFCIDTFSRMSHHLKHNVPSPVFASTIVGTIVILKILKNISIGEMHLPDTL